MKERADAKKQDDLLTILFFCRGWDSTCAAAQATSG
jgi:hypothetical protein